MIIAFVLLGCKPVNKLILMREKAIQNLTAANIIDNTEKFILDNKLFGDTWVIDIWNKKSKTEWVDFLNLHTDFLDEAIENYVKINCLGDKLESDWFNLIRHYIYLVEREAKNESSRTILEQI